MPTAGLALIAFMNEPDAIQYLQKGCMPADVSDAALSAEWRAARAKLGAPTWPLGTPDIQPIPATHQNYIVQLMQEPWVAGLFQNQWRGCTFAMVEIDALLAYQFSVDTVRSAHHCAPLSKPPTIDELLNLCLPITLAADQFELTPGAQSIILRSRSLNIRKIAEGWLSLPNVGNFLGIGFAQSIPLTHVVRLNGRCFLHNGFHRAIGARLAGATHMPCIVRDVPTAAVAGIASDGSTFGEALMQSANPPTVGHFTQGMAYDVQLRAVSRVINVSWSEYSIPTE